MDQEVKNAPKEGDTGIPEGTGVAEHLWGTLQAKVFSDLVRSLLLCGLWPHNKRAGKAPLAPRDGTSLTSVSPQVLRDDHVFTVRGWSQCPRVKGWCHGHQQPETHLWQMQQIHGKSIHH